MSALSLAIVTISSPSRDSIAGCHMPFDDDIVLHRQSALWQPDFVSHRPARRARLADEIAHTVRRGQRRRADAHQHEGLQQERPRREELV